SQSGTESRTSSLITPLKPAGRGYERSPFPCFPDPRFPAPLPFLRLLLMGVLLTNGTSNKCTPDQRSFLAERERPTRARAPTLFHVHVRRLLCARAGRRLSTAEEQLRSAHTYRARRRGSPQPDPPSEWVARDRDGAVSACGES